MYVRESACLCERACVNVRVRVCACVCERVCVSVRVSVYAWPGVSAGRHTL